MRTAETFLGFLNDWMSTELSVPSPSLKQDTQILEIGLLDSLQIVELVTAIEQTFDISVSLEELVEENFQTPDAIWKMVERQQGTTA